MKDAAAAATLALVQLHMSEILSCFKPGRKITVLVRTPGDPEADVCLSDDDMAEVVAMAERRLKYGKTGT